MTAFKLFAQERRVDLEEENPDMNNTDVNKMIQVEWRALDKPEQYAWKTKAAGC
jgi:hypothetical protein